MKNARESSKEFIVSFHARRMLAERAIKEEWLRQVLQSPEVLEPDKEDPDLEHALKRIPESGNRVLRVVFNKDMNPLRIVTVYFDRKAGRKP